MIQRNKIFNILSLGAIFLMALSFFIAPAIAAEKNGAGLFSAGYLHELCKSDSKGKETVKGGHTACQAYIAGVVDYHKLMRSLGTQPLMDICVPNDESMERLQNIVWVFLAKNPQHTDFLASPAVTLALYEYYPCPTEKKSAHKKRR